MENSIKFTQEAEAALTALRHSEGTYRFYSDTLGRLTTLILQQSDEIGMSDTEAMATLRASLSEARPCGTCRW